MPSTSDTVKRVVRDSVLIIEFTREDFGTGSRDDVVVFIPGDVYGAQVEGVHPPAFGPQEVA